MNLAENRAFNVAWQGSMAELEERLDLTERLSTKERAGSQV